MTSNAAKDFSLVLSRSRALGRIRVDLGSFLEFNSNIDYDLAALVGRWSDFITVESMVRSHTEQDRLG